MFGSEVGSNPASSSLPTDSNEDPPTQGTSVGLRRQNDPEETTEQKTPGPSFFTDPLEFPPTPGTPVGFRRREDPSEKSSGSKSSETTLSPIHIEESRSAQPGPPLPPMENGRTMLARFRSSFSITDQDYAEMSSEYAEDIHQYYLQQEEERLQDVSPVTISAAQYKKFVRWMAKIRTDQDLHEDVLMLAVSMFNGFMRKSNEVLDPRELHLVATTCMLLASKYDHRQLYITAKKFNRLYGLYSIHRINEMECCILRTLNFELGHPFSSIFLAYMRYKFNIEEETIEIAKYLTELALYDLDLSQKKPSIITLAVTSLAASITEDWKNMSAEVFYADKTPEIEQMKARLIQLASDAPEDEDTSASYRVFTQRASIKEQSWDVLNERENRMKRLRRE